MLKIVKSIVDPKRNLIGFMLEGKEKEFGGMSSNKVVQPISIKELINRKFSNNQIAVSENKLMEKNNFKINSIPMCVFTGNNYIDVDNTFNLTARYVQNNENIGFEVVFGDGSKLNFKYEQIIALATWFKPGNFMIRKSSTNKYFISGKAGHEKLSDLPAVNIGEESKAKRLKSSAKEKTEKFNGVLPNGFDILDVYSFIDSCGGCIIKLPNEKYTGVDKTSKVLDEKAGFVSLGIGEVASAKPMYNASKLNVNAGFKKVGVVNIPLNGQKIGITTFTYRTKSIFLKGENNIKKFGIAVPIERENDLVKALGGSLALQKITDETITKPLGQVIDASALVFYTVDTSQIDLISNKKQDDSILSANELTEILKERFVLNLITKMCSPKTGLIKEIKNELGPDEFASANDKKPFGIFATMSKEYLDTISTFGIDVYTGAFDSVKALGEGYKAPSSPKSEEDGEENIVIEYTLKGYEAGKISYKIIAEEAAKGTNSKVPESVTKIYNELISIDNLKDRLKAAQRIYNEADKKFNETTKRLWMHNASMFIKGNKSKIHTHDSKNWAIDTSSRVKTATVYAYTGKDINGLSVKVSGVTI